MTHHYEQQKRWKRRHPKLWAQQKQRYYERGACHLTAAERRSKRLWSDDDELRILAHRELDRVLALRLGRTIRAIQVHRCKIKKVRDAGAR